jgi:hypothetical protein
MARSPLTHLRVCSEGEGLKFIQTILIFILSLPFSFPPAGRAGESKREGMLEENELGRGVVKRKV